MDLLNLTLATPKPVLQTTVERQPGLRENFFNWRDRSLKLYDSHAPMDVLQQLIEGKPHPPTYLKASP